MKGGYDTLVSGETGTGKSVIISSYLNTLDEEKYVNNIINFSA